MHGALQKIKMRRADKTEAVRGLRAAVLEYLSKSTRCALVERVANRFAFC